MGTKKSNSATRSAVGESWLSCVATLPQPLQMIDRGVRRPQSGGQKEAAGRGRNPLGHRELREAGDETCGNRKKILEAMHENGP